MQTLLLPSTRLHATVASPPPARIRTQVSASPAAASAVAPSPPPPLPRRRPHALGGGGGGDPSRLSPLPDQHRGPHGLVLSLPKFPSLCPPLSCSAQHSASPLPEMKRGPSATRASAPAAGYASPDGEPERAKLAQVSKRLENTSRYFKRLGSLGFWGQLVCTVVSAVILSFSTVISGKITSPATFYATAAGIAAAFVSVFWSFGYIRLSERLRRTAGEPTKAPPRAEVVKSLKNGIVVNLLGLGAAVLGMQATVGLLVAKALTTSAVPYYQGIAAGRSPVLALDVFLVQASANTILSHFLGLVFSLELLRKVTLPLSEGVPIPKPA